MESWGNTHGLIENDSMTKKNIQIKFQVWIFGISSFHNEYDKWLLYTRHSACNLNRDKYNLRKQY